MTPGPTPPIPTPPPNIATGAPSPCTPMRQPRMSCGVSVTGEGQHPWAIGLTAVAAPIHGHIRETRRYRPLHGLRKRLRRAFFYLKVGVAVRDNPPPSATHVPAPHSSTTSQPTVASPLNLAPHPACTILPICAMFSPGTRSGAWPIRGGTSEQETGHLLTHELSAFLS